ncbi:hypothetical protein CHARACLAT_027708 [Characodon lateralis]|uniref:Uncharacterized protein n=1 Tax=Characodon lateralis TaxID=208331 RepID=A0ABU7DKE7_9TELE|nr:hypothetical protein [Characodon lateralis]
MDLKPPVYGRNANKTTIWIDLENGPELINGEAFSLWSPVSSYTVEPGQLRRCKAPSSWPLSHQWSSLETMVNKNLRLDPSGKTQRPTQNGQPFLHGPNGEQQDESWQLTETKGTNLSPWTNFCGLSPLPV